MRRHIRPFLNSGGPNAPVSGMALWLDAQDPVNGLQLSSGVAISGWTDKSGNGNTGVLVGALTQKKVGGRIWAGDFSSSNYFNCGSGIVLSETAGHSIFGAIYPLDAAGSGFQIPVGIAGSSYAVLVAAPSTTYGDVITHDVETPGVVDAPAHTGATPLAVPNVFGASLTAGGATVSVQQNRDAAATAAWGRTGASTNDQTWVGNFKTTSAPFSHGYIGEILIYTSKLTAAQELLNMQYLRAKYQR